MAKNQRYTNALHIAVTAPKDIKSGDPVQVGQISGVAQIDALSGEKVTIWLDGSWNIPVAGALASEGLPVFITSAGALTAAGTGNTPWGVALATKTTGTAPVEVVPLGYTAGATA
ncbi:capsid cement protein [Glutamicibacter arilaitensis]|uniref:capsid cement protein n=1 Tax=Glutamicibacter arilaitensis TaxID=256701 RepID=UPI00384E4BBC